MEHFPLVDRLHTDVLEEKYGPISSKVILHNDRIRLSHLVDNKGISRTFAITFFNKGWNKEIKEINEEIKKGKPIGKIFRKHEYAIRKNVLEVYKIRIPNWLKKEFRTEGTHAKARLSEFYAKKKGITPVIYGVVVEIYSPDFRKAVINKTDMAQESALTSSLEKHGFVKEEIWKRIGRENDYEDDKNKFRKAKKNSDKLESSFKKRINEILKNPPL
jgi:hypothetical protein